MSFAAPDRRADWLLAVPPDSPLRLPECPVVNSAAALDARLNEDWSLTAVVLDFALATPELLARFARPGAPRLLAVVDAAHADLAGTVISVAAGFVDSDASPEELREVLTAAVVSTPRGVADFSERTAANIGLLSREVERIAAALAELANGGGAAPVPVETRIDAGYVRSLLKARRVRERFFPAELFSDPAWDMLLDLTAAELEGRRVSVSSLCIAAAVPTTTALRWIRNLCDLGLFVRQTDPGDARRAFIAPSPATFEAMRRCLGAIRGTAVPG